jgi:toxin YhaV
LLAAVLKVAFDDIPGDPTRDIYRQGSALGDDYRHWFRAKFLQQFRLFFRYQQSARLREPN